MRRISALALSLTASLLLAPRPAALAQESRNPQALRTIMEAVDGASAVRVRTRDFEADLDDARIIGGELLYGAASVRAGACGPTGCPRRIPFSEVVQVDVFRPHPLLAAAIGAVAGYAIGEMAIRQQEREELEECTGPPSTRSCYFLGDDTKQKFRLGSAILFVPLAIYTDRVHFAWRTIYRTDAF